MTKSLFPSNSLYEIFKRITCKSEYNKTMKATTPPHFNDFLQLTPNPIYLSSFKEAI